MKLVYIIDAINDLLTTAQRLLHKVQRKYTMRLVPIKSSISRTNSIAVSLSSISHGSRAQYNE